MTKEQIYQAVLEELADAGNEQAKLALSIAKKLNSLDGKSQIINELKDANIALGHALGHNDSKWTKSTDVCIKNAQNNIVNVVAMIGMY